MLYFAHNSLVQSCCWETRGLQPILKELERSGAYPEIEKYFKI